MYAPDTGPGCYHDRLTHPAQLEAEQARDHELRDSATRYHTQRVLDAIAAGKVLFTRTATGWAIVGPTHAITPGEPVTVTRYDGDTNTVRATVIRGTHEHNGLAYTVAAYQPIDPGTVQIPDDLDDLDDPQPLPGASTLRKIAFGLGYMIGHARRNPYR